MYKILLVEDEPHLLELYQEELQDEGYEVMSTMDGEEAVLLTKKNLPDLVVLDIKIKKLHGLEVLKKIKEFNKDLPVVLNSAYETFKSDFSSWIADAYLIKSSNLAELKEKIAELLVI
ncbi:MAG: response regulator [candidate division Zixibacteria bacterium]|nr:response regulator [candidate division Zixibacteria bacterium]